MYMYTHAHADGMVTEEKKKKTKTILGIHSKAGWPKCLRLVQATPLTNFAVITAQL